MEDENVVTAGGQKTGGLAVGPPHGPISTRSVLGGALAGSTIAGPLFGMMGFSFLASLTVLLVSFPLLLLFSPLLLGAALVFAGAVAGLGVAAVTAVAGMATLGWVFRELGAHRRFLTGRSTTRGRPVDMLAEIDEKPSKDKSYHSA